MIFDWDEKKNLSNIRKHGVGFVEATYVFIDDFKIVKPDLAHSEAELRYYALGLSDRRVLCVVFIEVINAKLRIISARKATKRERLLYERNR